MDGDSEIIKSNWYFDIGVDTRVDCVFEFKSIQRIFRVRRARMV